MAELLLKAGANPNCRVTDGTTPLMVAAAHGQAGIACDLLEHGADPARVTKTGQTALTEALNADCPHIVRMLQRALHQM